ncbi:MAG: glycosyltransferase family 4 protein [Nitrospirota bacterium]
MKILHIHSRYDRFGGGERYLFDLCDALEEKGHEIMVLSSPHPENYRGSGERKEYFIENSFGIRSGYRMRGRVEDLIRQEAPDIVHVHETLGFISPLIIGRIMKHFPAVQTLHTAFFFARRAQRYCRMANCVCIPWGTLA